MPARAHIVSLVPYHAPHADRKISTNIHLAKGQHFALPARHDFRLNVGWPLVWYRLYRENKSYGGLGEGPPIRRPSGFRARGGVSDSGGRGLYPQNLLPCIASVRPSPSPSPRNMRAHSQHRELTRGNSPTRAARPSLWFIKG